MDDRIRVHIEFNRDEPEICVDVSFCVGSRVVSTMVLNRDEVEAIAEKLNNIDWGTE